MKRAIGGYFELELQRRGEYHARALRFNTARNCLEYVLRARRYTKVYLPYYTCEAVLEPIRRLQIAYAFYPIDARLEPGATIDLKPGEGLVYTNYFGLKQRCVEQLARHYGEQLIVDNAQAFYAPRVEGIDTIYSPRKFFGVPDGGYLYTDAPLLPDAWEQDRSCERMGHLLRRIEAGAEGGYAQFRQSEESLDNQPIRTMSLLTRALLSGVDYEEVCRQRRRNFAILHRQLGATNRLCEVADALEEVAVPMVYPYLTEKGACLRRELIGERIYVASYWPNVAEWCSDGMWERVLADRMLALPIDQRYDEGDMQRIVELIDARG